MEKRPQHGDGQSGQEPNSKKRKSDVSASSSSKKKSDFKSVLVLRSGIDVFPENGQIPLPNNKGLTKLRNVSSGRFKTDVEFTNRMSASDVEEVLKQNFPILEKYTSFSCASAADNRSKLEFHEDQQTTGVWSGADIKRHIRGNSALYILAEGAPEAGTACEGSERAANRCSGQLVLQKHGPSGVGSSLVGTRMLQTLAGKSHHRSLPKFPSTINQIGSGAHVSTSSATITDNYRSPNTELSRTDSQQGDCDKESNQKSLDRIPSIAHDLQSEVSTHGNGSINSVEKDLTPSIIFNMSEEEFDSAIEDIQDDTGAVRMCLSSKAQQILKMSGEEFDSAMEDVNEVISGDSGAVKKVCPSSGSTRGGGEFSIILNQQLQNEEEDFVADFEDVRNVLLTVENCFTLTGVTPAYHREGCVLVMVRSASGTWLGSATYTYVNPNKKEELRKVVEDKNKWKEILDTMSNGQIGNLDQQEIPSGAVVHGKTRDSWSIKLLTLLIYQAAEVDGFDFLEVVFSTSAGRVTFNNYKDNAIRPEDVARAYGHAILGDFLENVNKRLSKEVGNEDNNETINWLELKKTMETEGNPPRTNDAQPAGHLPRNDSYSDYDADDETSPLPSPSDTEANVDEMHGDLSFYKFSVWESSSQENDIRCMEIDGSDNQHEGNSPSLRNGETDSNRDFCENHLYCTIKIGADSASQQKKEKKRRKKQGIESRNEESPTQSEDIMRKCNALLNFGGGVLEMKIADPQSKGASKKDPVDCFWQTIEGQLKTMIRPSKYDDVFDRRVFSDKILLFVNAPKHLCTMKYNLFVSGDSGVDDANYDDVVGFLKLESDSHKRNLKSNIQVPLQDLPPIPCTFFHQKVISLMECKQVQFKDFTSDSLLFSHPKQRFSIARQLSAFGNCDGGVLLIGVRDDRRVSGVDMVKSKKEHVEECVSSLVDKMCCNFKLQRGIHWDLTFSDVSGSESKSVIVVKMAGMRDAGGIFGKCPESYILQCDEDGQQVPHQLDFDKWKGRMKSDDAHLTGNTRGMIDMLSRFQQMRVSEGHLLTVRGDVQRIRDAFFKGDDTFLVSPEGVESSLPAEAQAVIRNIQKVCRRDRFRGFLAVSRSWLRDTGGTAVDSVICDVLLVSRNMGGLHLYTLCDAADETSFQYSKEAAQSIKKRLSENGARGQKFYVSSHVLPCRAGREVKFPSPDDRYPKSYDLLSPRGKLNEILKAMVVTLAAVPSTLSYKLGVTFFNLLTTEQFRLVHQQIEVNRELWIKGVAGTGKTLVAVEFMRELRRREKLQRNEILYVCENEGIASQVRKTDLCNAICRVTFIYGEFPQTKHVILDEVHNFEQPNGTFSWYEKAKDLVRQHDPDRPGYLWCFIDLCQKSHSFPSGIPEETRQRPQLRLRKVIRNSTKIFKHAKKYLVDNDWKDKVEIGHDFDGEDVRIIPYSKNETTELDVLHTTLRQLFKEGYSERDISVLFLKNDSIPSDDMLSEKLNGLSWKSAKDNDSEKIVISSVLKYSGLERPVVVLVNVHRGLPRRHTYSFIYGAVTRAMVKLIIIRCRES